MYKGETLVIISLLPWNIVKIVLGVSDAKVITCLLFWFLYKVKYYDKSIQFEESPVYLTEDIKTS